MVSLPDPPEPEPVPYPDSEPEQTARIAELRSPEPSRPDHSNYGFQKGDDHDQNQTQKQKTPLRKGDGHDLVSAPAARVPLTAKPDVWRELRNLVPSMTIGEEKKLQTAIEKKGTTAEWLLAELSRHKPLGEWKCGPVGALMYLVKQSNSTLANDVHAIIDVVPVMEGIMTPEERALEVAIAATPRRSEQEKLALEGELAAQMKVIPVSKPVRHEKVRPLIVPREYLIAAPL